jgi:hypothetical protein
MANITICDLHPASGKPHEKTDDISIMSDMTDRELEQIHGGVLSLLVLSFGAGYAVGTAIYKTFIE